MNPAEQAGLDRIIRFEKKLGCRWCGLSEAECQCTLQEIRKEDNDDTRQSGTGRI